MLTIMKTALNKKHIYTLRRLITEKKNTIKNEIQSPVKLSSVNRHEMKNSQRRN